MERVEVSNLGLLPLAGVATYEEASRPGYGVEENVALLRRYNYVETNLNQIAAAHIAATPEWEVKCALSLHLWLDAEHSAALRTRVSEMREPPLHLDQVPDPRLQVLLDEVIRADNTIELLVGVYRVVKSELAAAYRHHLAQTNPLIDHPTCRMMRINLREEEEMIAWGEQAIAALTQTPEAQAVAQAWETHLRAVLAAAGGIAGDGPDATDAPLPDLRTDGQPYEMRLEPRRDERFVDPYNGGALIDEYYRDETRPYDERAYALVYKRLREMDVPEWMGPILYTTKGKPWDYYVDVSRQLWDEARHAMMGEVALVKDGMPFYAYPVDVKTSALLNTVLTPFEAHVALWNTEQGLMPRETGKKYEWVIAQHQGDDLLTTFQDYDWADEVLHTQIGRRWLKPHFKNPDDLQTLISSIGERLREPYAEVRTRSPQYNWWPDFLAHIRRTRASVVSSQ